MSPSAGVVICYVASNVQASSELECQGGPSAIRQSSNRAPSSSGTVRYMYAAHDMLPSDPSPRHGSEHRGGGLC